MHLTLYDGCNYISMLVLKLKYVSKQGPRCHAMVALHTVETWTIQETVFMETSHHLCLKFMQHVEYDKTMAFTCTFIDCQLQIFWVICHLSELHNTTHLTSMIESDVFVFNCMSSWSTVINGCIGLKALIQFLNKWYFCQIANELI